MDGRVNRSSIPVSSNTLYLLYKPSRPALGTTRHPGQRASECTSGPEADHSPPAHVQVRNEWGCTTTPHTPYHPQCSPHCFTLPLLPSVCVHSCPCVVYPRRHQAVVQWWRRRLRPTRRSPALYTHASSARRCASRPQRQRVRCVWFEDCKQTDWAWHCIHRRQAEVLWDETLGRWVDRDFWNVWKHKPSDKSQTTWRN